ncbi:hypothetical protein Angca_007655, partial [Angiostrongylus cantonensis]
EFKLGRRAAETVRNINEVWGEGRVGESTVRTRFRKLRPGSFHLQDKEGRGRSNEPDDDELKELDE